MGEIATEVCPPATLILAPEAILLPFLLTCASVVAAVVPMVGFLAVVWWLDRYDREPAWTVLLTFAWGALIATTLSLIGNTSLDLLLHAVVGPHLASQITPVVVAPLVEEPTKAVVLLLVLQSRRFDNATDGFVYGAAAGLGFGMTENLLYFVTAAKAAEWAPLEGTLAWLTTVAARTFFSAVMHAAASALVGAALGSVRFRPTWTRVPAAALGLGAAIAMHATWNGLLTAASAFDQPALVALDFALFPVELLAVFGLFQACLWGERRTLRRELLAEARDEGTLPEDAALAVASYLRRSLGRVGPPGVHRRSWVRAATTVGFRRAQLRKAVGADRAVCMRDLERERRALRDMQARPTAASPALSEAPADWARARPAQS